MKDEQSSSQAIEEAFVHAFIVPDKQGRYQQMMSSPSKRKKILGQLYHNLDIIAAWSMPIANRDNHTDFIVKLLRQKGARQRCYLISPEPELDQHEMPLIEAIQTLIARDSTAIICCVPDRLAYYKAETHQYLLERTH